MIARVHVLQSKSETPTTRTVRFTRPPGFAFRPVQFCGLELATDEGPIEYSMSLACSPTKEYLEFGARVTSGTPWKRAFASLRPGDEAEIDGPYGHFVLDESVDAVFVAGGIGITPLRGMLEYAADRRLPIRIQLLYSNRTPQEIAYRAELDQIAKKNPRIQVTHTVTRPSPQDEWPGRIGRIDAALLEAAARGLEDPKFYVCGLPSMVEDTFRMLRDQGHARSHIVFEEFWGYE